MDRVKAFADMMINHVAFYTNADMPQLIYEADLAIGAAGSSVWERCCLGLLSILMKTADNQNLIYDNLIRNGICFSDVNLVSFLEKKEKFLEFFDLFKGNGLEVIMEKILIHEQ